MAKILIVDDETPIRKMLRKLFEKNGYEVVDACNGHEGIKLFKEHEPDLIITDLIMPEKEGLETIREIKELNPAAKIIALSGGGMANPETYLTLAEKFGAVRAFSKPIDSKLLLSAIKEILSS